MIFYMFLLRSVDFKESKPTNIFKRKRGAEFVVKSKRPPHDPPKAGYLVQLGLPGTSRDLAGQD